MTISLGTLALRDGNGNPVAVEVILLPSGNLLTQSTPSDATGAPYCTSNPLATSDVNLRPGPDDAAPQITSASLGDRLAAMLAEQRLTNLLLAQAFGIEGDDLTALRSALLAET